MHHAFDRAERIVGDRIGAFFLFLLELARIGHELPRDRIVGIIAVDQIRHRRRERHRITRRHFGKRIELVARHQRLGAKLVDRAQCVG